MYLNTGLFLLDYKREITDAERTKERDRERERETEKGATCQVITRKKHIQNSWVIDYYKITMN